MASIETLFRRFRMRGDVAALGEVFDRTADAMLRVALHLVRDPIQVEECLQETYLIAIKRAETWDASRPLRPWLLGILRNVVRRSFAARKHLSLPRASQATVSPNDPVEDSEWTSAVADAVEAMSDPYRSVLMLHLLHRLSPTEIARLQRVPPATIRSQIYRGLEQLRTLLPKEHRTPTSRALFMPLGLSTIRSNVLKAGHIAAPALVSTANLAGISLLGALAMQKITTVALAIAIIAFAALDPLHLWTGKTDDQVREGAAETRVATADAAPSLAGGARTAKDSAKTPSITAGPDVDLDNVDRARDLHGTVVLENGQPVVGATVHLDSTPWHSLMINNARNPETRPLGSTRTGPKGTFVFRLTEGSRGLLRVSAPGYAERRVWLAAAGERVRIVIDRSVELIVRVAAPDGEPAPHAPIRVLGAGIGASPGAPAIYKTDEAGVARIEGLDSSSSVTVWVTPTREGWGRSEIHVVALPASGTCEHRIQLPVGRTIRGVVTDATSGSPIRDSTVGMGWMMEPFVRTDDSGSYTLHGWTGRGIREITAAAAGYVRARLAVDGDTDAYDFALVKGAIVHGRVVDDSGTPIARARVAAVGSAHGTSGQRLSMANAWTDSEGRFTLRDLSSDLTIDINVRADQYARRFLSIPPVGEGEHDMGDIALTMPLTLSGNRNSRRRLARSPHAGTHDVGQQGALVCPNGKGVHSMALRIATRPHNRRLGARRR